MNALVDRPAIEVWNHVGPVFASSRRRCRRPSNGGRAIGRAIGPAGRARAALVCCTLIGWLLAAPGPRSRAGDAAGAASAERWIAPDAVACLQIAHPDRLIDRATDPQIQKYLKLLPAYRMQIDGKKFAEVSSIVKMIASQLGTTWDKGLGDLTAGGILAAFEADAGQEPRLYVIVTPRDPGLLERTSATVLRLARQDAKDKGTPDPFKTAEYHGVTIWSLQAPNAPAYAIIQGKLAVSNSARNLERLIDRATATGAPSADNKAPAALADHPDWKSLKEKHGPEALAWALLRLDRLRAIDPAKYTLKEKPDTGIVLLFGSWYEAIRQAPLLRASLSWSDTELGASVETAAPKAGRGPAFKGYAPAAGKGAVAAIRPPGTMAALSLWRDWSTIWEARTDLFQPETVQGFAQLDTFAGQFFGVREFGPDVLGAFEPHWRLVVAQQDFAAMQPTADVKLPAFALVTELNAPDSDFAQRLKVAFQTFVGLSNVDAVQKKGPPLELGSEVVDGVTLATAKYMVPKADDPATITPHRRYNFSPSVAQVGKYFFLSSSAELARNLIKELKAISAAGAPREGGETVVLEADGAEVAKLLEFNRAILAAQVMLGGGETKENAERQVNTGLALLRYLGHARAFIVDEPAATRLEVKLKLAR